MRGWSHTRLLLTGMFARETADPRGAVCQVARGSGVVQTLQIVGRTEDRRHTAPTIGTVPGSLVPPVAVVGQAGVGRHHVVDSVGLALTTPGQQQEGGRCEEDWEEHPRTGNRKIQNNYYAYN